jgi:hypothetical protein
MPEANPPTILLVGHCFPDAMMLKAAIKRILPGVWFEKAHSVVELEQGLAGSALALVNRVLDGDFGDHDGVGLIRRYAAHESGTTLMLISNLAQPQSEAEAAGAAPGFGKTQLYDGETAARIRAAIKQSSPS